ncbi:MAG: hypothetical protein LBS35_00780, partial [Synergistaceae bacterium]|nr:hypothetical protein [Synergistaceae bacterium]
MRVLVLEASTSAAKALVYDYEKGILSVESENYGPKIDSGGVHDARGVYDVCLRLGRKAVSKAGKENIAAVACVGVWHSVAPCDGAMNPVTGAYLWNFTGTGGICRRVRERTEEARDIYRRTGCMPNITYQPYALLYLQ